MAGWFDEDKVRTTLQPLWRESERHDSRFWSEKTQLQKSLLREVRWGKSERPRALRTWYNLRCDSVHHATTLVLMLWNSCSNIVQRYNGKFEMDNVHDTVQKSILTARHLRLTITTAKVVITESYTMSLRERIIKTSFVPNVMKTSDGNLSVGQDRRLSVFMSVQSRFSFFFFLRLFLLQNARKSVEIYEKYQFLVFFGATDRNFTEKYSVTPSW